MDEYDDTLDLLGGDTPLPAKKKSQPLASEESSSYPNHSQIQLGLSLGLCTDDVFVSKPDLSSPATAIGDRWSKISTAKDCSSIGEPSTTSSSSSSSSSLTVKANLSAGAKRTADHSAFSTANRGGRQVVGWPPVGNHRMNNLINQAKSAFTQDFDSEDLRTTNMNGVVDAGNNTSVNPTVWKEQSRTLLVKVYMDGDPIGRKVNLNSHICYDTLAGMLEDMFFGSRKSKTTTSRLLAESSEFVLTYEDKDGDYMKVGDIPWRMFTSSVKRLRIMRKPVVTNGFGEE